MLSPPVGSYAFEDSVTYNGVTSTQSAVFLVAGLDSRLQFVAQ
jgi:hypothetical protein